jgi:hypothetical protein
MSPSSWASRRICRRHALRLAPIRGPAYPAYNHKESSAEARVNLRAQRIFDTGLILGVGTDFLLYHDKFSGDQYDNDFVEKIFFFVQTGFGRVE